MNYQKSLQYLTSQEKFQINLGLERMQKLAQLFSNPQDNLKIIHIAGTNGKGSTCAMLAAILKENGFKVGLYTSPHLKSYTERFQINFKNISEEKFSDYLQKVDKVAKENNINLTEFEILTMMAFLYFQDEKVDYAIMETGMGGRLDATNIVKKPVLTIITSISLDHVDRLGATLKEIAFEKAGILKENTPVVISFFNKGFDVIKEQATKLNAPVLNIEKEFELIDFKENIFSNGEKTLKISLLGINQAQNLTLVIKACEYLQIEPKKALEKVFWQSRMQYIKEKNLLVDAAHNQDAVKLLKKNLEIYFPNKSKTFLFGVLNTKNYQKIIYELFTEKDTIYLIDDFAKNAVSAIELEKCLKEKYPAIKIKPININQINEFVEKDIIEGIKICCGSFYLCEKVL